MKSKTQPTAVSVKVSAEIYGRLSDHCQKEGRIVKSFVDSAVTEKLDRETKKAKGTPCQ